MQRYERKAATRRFWEISLSGKQTIEREGVVGKEGTTEKLTWATTGDAKTEHDRRIAKRVKRGYKLVSQGPNLAPKLSASSKRSNELEAAIRENPDDAAAWLVYADWLNEQGDPRGELVVVQEARSRKPRDRALKKEEERLFDKHFDVWVGDMQEHMTADWSGIAALSFEWKNGFFRSATVAEQDLLTELLTHPSATFLEELTVLPEADDIYQAMDEGNAAGLAEQLAPLDLRGLVLGQARAASWMTYGDITKLLKPALRKLAVHGSSVIKRAPALMPDLQELTLYLGGSGSIEIATILAAAPNLTKLSLTGSNLGDDLAKIIVEAKCAASLEELDLSSGSITGKGVTILKGKGAKRKLPKLRSINLSRNYLDDDAQMALDGIAQEIIDRDQLVPPGWQG